MKLSEYFHLNKSQAELDFVDIDFNRDMRLFIDPYLLSKNTDKFSIEAVLTVQSFFQQVIYLIRGGQRNEAKALFRHLREPNATCLGLSRNNPQGKGAGPTDASNIFDSLLSSRAVQTGVIQDIEDTVLFVDGFGKDKLSDMVTNIIKNLLIEYTQRQCELHGILLTENINSDYYWDRFLNGWDRRRTNMLIVEGKPILLVPKGIVSFCRAYAGNKYYNNFVLNFIERNDLQIRALLMRTRKNGAQYILKKELKRERPFSKEFLRTFTREHSEVLANFKLETDVAPLKNSEIADIDIQEVINRLTRGLRNITVGNDHVPQFYNTIIGILELVFYPNLINPHKEGGNICLKFDNAARMGFFRDLIIARSYIFFECRNESFEADYSALDELTGRFTNEIGQVGFIICRQINDRNRLIRRCRDIYRNGRGLIIPLDDDDLIRLLQNCNDLESRFIESFLLERGSEIMS